MTQRVEWKARNHAQSRTWPRAPGPGQHSGPRMTPDGSAHVRGDGDPGQLRPRSARRTFPGSPEQVSRARQFVADALGPVPVLDEIVLLVSELCANAVLHTASGEGGTFEISVLPGLGPCSVRIEVRDGGSDHAPALSPGEALAETGRGLGLVELLAERWGCGGDGNGRTVFFEAGWKAPD